MDCGLIPGKSRVSLAKRPGRGGMRGSDPLDLDRVAGIKSRHVLISIVHAGSDGSGISRTESAARVAGDGSPRRGSPRRNAYMRSRPWFGLRFGLEITRDMADPSGHSGLRIRARSLLATARGGTDSPMSCEIAVLASVWLELWHWRLRAMLQSYSSARVGLQHSGS